MKRYNIIIINGRFLSQNLTGVQRYALEITKALDELVENSPLHFELAVSQDAQNIPSLRNIKIIVVGNKTGIIWEQTELAAYISKQRGFGLHLCNSVPIFYPKGIACIHDITYKVNPQFITTKHLFFAKIWHLIQYSVALKKSSRVFTVSEYSKNEIIQTYHIPAKKVFVAYNGWQHFSTAISSGMTLETEYPKLKSGEFFFSLATAAKNKNFPWIVKAAIQNPTSNFVVAGKIDLQKLGNTIGENLPSNLTLMGYVSDEHAKLLMKNCRAFLFPSLYEGFGIPPLEALAMGAKVICSNAACLPEIFKDCVYYIDPNTQPPNLETLLTQEIQPAQKILDMYDWQKSAEIYKNTLEMYLN